LEQKNNLRGNTMNHIDKTIEDLRKAIADKERELGDAKRTVNNLCQMVGRPLLYELENQPSVMPTGQLRGDEYYGRPLATVITTVLEARKGQGVGPDKVKEIYEQMIVGGYQFDAKSDVNAMRGIRISMAKNPKFHKLPNGKWGLTKWYPSAKESKESNKIAKEIVDEITEEESTDSK